MKIIQTIYNGYDFQSDILTTSVSWNEFKTILYNTLEWKSLRHEDVQANGTNFVHGIILPHLYKGSYWIMQDDDFHIMIKCWRQDENIQETHMFYLMREVVINA